MARPKRTAATIAPRKALLEWIDSDDDDTSFALPACSANVKAIHARIPLATGGISPSAALPPPPGLRLAPLG